MKSIRKSIRKSKRYFVATMMGVALMVFLCVPKLPTYAAGVSVSCTCSSPDVRYTYIASYPAPPRTRILYVPVDYTDGSVGYIQQYCIETGTMNMFYYYCLNCGADLGDHGNVVSIVHSNQSCPYRN
jgi:hypothetical protein